MRDFYLSAGDEKRNASFNKLLMTTVARLHYGFSVACCFLVFFFKRKAHVVSLARSKADYSGFCVTFRFGWL